MSDLFLPLVGGLIGLFVVAFGGGGGLMYVGVLSAVFHVEGPVAASTSLATIIPTTVIGAYSHWRAGNVRIDLGGYLFGGGAIGAIIGALLSTKVPPALYARLIGVILLAMGLPLLRRRKKTGLRGSPQPGAQFLGVGFGFVGGVLSGLVGISGSPPVLAGLAILGCSATEVIGTSVLVLIGIAVVGFLTHLHVGNVAWTLVAELGLGASIGAFGGPFLLRRVNGEKFETIYRMVVLALVVVLGLLLVFSPPR